ncbi:protein of unknown function (plasmid) [Paraburkholderia dioscoreae]|uniref:Uncharacterized protein n=1 Tax=Paraburkholderia dioscoreae TaxID=2604047 RepID=A0A5Q4ZHB2_9BURK|nr:protein of unknown function [Paraburkholderia dioscoreae]
MRDFEREKIEFVWGHVASAS